MSEHRRGCHWIHGEPAGTRTVFCGAPTIDGVWCAEHRAIVYVQTEPIAPPTDDESEEGPESLPVAE